MDFIEAKGSSELEASLSSAISHEYCLLSCSFMWSCCLNHMCSLRIAYIPYCTVLVYVSVCLRRGVRTVGAQMIYAPRDRITFLRWQKQMGKSVVYWSRHVCVVSTYTVYCYVSTIES